MSFDPLAIVTAIGIVLGSITGTPSGYGVQVGAVIRPGESVVVGVDPIVYYDSPGLADIGVGGATLGTVTLVAPASAYARVAARDMGIPEALAFTLEGDFARAYNNMLDYERGHREFWNRFGLWYFVKILESPCDYDPAYNWGTYCPGPYSYMGYSVNRQAYTRALPAPEHYAVKFTIWEAR